MRKVEVDIFEILELIICAEDYGFEDDMLFDSLADMIGEITEDDIAEYIEIYSENDGYSEIELYDMGETLREFNKTYFNS